MFKAIVAFLVLISAPATAQIIFQDSFDGCTMDDAWSVMQYEWATTSNGMLLGLHSAAQIGAGSPMHGNYSISMKWLPQSGQSLFVIINSTQDPETRQWNPEDPGHFLLLWIQANGTMIIGDSTTFGVVTNYTFALTEAYGPWQGRWTNVAFGLNSGQIFARVTLEDGRELAAGSAPVRAGLTSTSGFWNIETQGSQFSLFDDIVVTGEGPVSNDVKALGTIRSLFR